MTLTEYYLSEFLRDKNAKELEEDGYETKLHNYVNQALPAHAVKDCPKEMAGQSAWSRLFALTAQPQAKQGLDRPLDLVVN